LITKYTDENEILLKNRKKLKKEFRNVVVEKK